MSGTGDAAEGEDGPDGDSAMGVYSLTGLDWIPRCDGVHQLRVNGSALVQVLSSVIVIVGLGETGSSATQRIVAR